MHPELSQLLEAIHLDPKDDALWLVVADWLEENDDPRRSEMLRLVRGLRGVPEGPERIAPETRVAELLREGVTPCAPVRINSIGMQLALIPPGYSYIGSPEDEDGRYGDEHRKRIELTNPFFLGVHEVTQAQYAQVMGNNPSAFSAKGRMRSRVKEMDTSQFPVERMTHGEAMEFCVRLGELPEEQKAGRSYRLPTEIEWEFACRGEASQMFPTPYGKSITPAIVNFRPSRRAKGSLNRPAAVGSYPPNAFGLYEMLGNLWEWCSDGFEDDAYLTMAARNPKPTTSTERYNARGGTYALDLRRARTSDRSSFEPDHRDIDCGLRVYMAWQKPTRKRRKSPA